MSAAKVRRKLTRIQRERYMARVFANPAYYGVTWDQFASRFVREIAKSTPTIMKTRALGPTFGTFEAIFGGDKS